MTTVDELRDVLQGQRTRVTNLRERVQDKYLRTAWCLRLAFWTW